MIKIYNEILEKHNSANKDTYVLIEAKTIKNNRQRHHGAYYQDIPTQINCTYI